MADKYVYEVREISWQAWEVTENGKQLSVMADKRSAELWLRDWIKNGRRDDFYNMVGK